MCPHGRDNQGPENRACQAAADPLGRRLCLDLALDLLRNNDGHADRSNDQVSIDNGPQPIQQDHDVDNQKGIDRTLHEESVTDLLAGKDQDHQHKRAGHQGRHRDDRAAPTLAGGKLPHAGQKEREDGRGARRLHRKSGTKRGQHSAQSLQRRSSMRGGGRLIWRYRWWRNPFRDPEVLVCTASTMHDSSGRRSRCPDTGEIEHVP